MKSYKTVVFFMFWFLINSFPLSCFGLTSQEEKLLPYDSDNKWIFHQHLLPKSGSLFVMCFVLCCIYDIYFLFWFSSYFEFPCRFSKQYRGFVAFCCYHPQNKTYLSTLQIVHRNTAVPPLELKMFKLVLISLQNPPREVKVCLSLIFQLTLNFFRK